MPYEIQRRWQNQLLAEYRPGYTKAEIEGLNQEEIMDVFAFKKVQDRLIKQKQ